MHVRKKLGAAVIVCVMRRELACLVSGRRASVHIYMCTARNGCYRRNRPETGEPAAWSDWLAGWLAASVSHFTPGGLAESPSALLDREATLTLSG
eukprot:1164320-Prymnesium_polylepis.1